MHKSLPTAINDFMATIEKDEIKIINSALSEIKEETKLSKRSILDQITFDNFAYYFGFNDL
jgi:hypothetical protein